MTIYVVGGINLDDRYLMARLPKPGETVISTSTDSGAGGKGANQAIAAAAAGAPAVMLGAVGDDQAGRDVLRALARRNVDVAGVLRRTETRTGRAVVLVDESGENCILVSPGANATLVEADFAVALNRIRPTDTLLLQNEIPAAVNRSAARLARSKGATVVWNAAPAPQRQEEMISDIDLLVVNEHELASIAQLLDLPSQIIPEAVSAVAYALHVRVVCTRGARGATYSDGLCTQAVAAPRVIVVDTTAAGDSFVGYLAAHLIRPLDQAIKMANTAGAAAVTRPGASSSIPTLAELTEFELPERQPERKLA